MGHLARQRLPLGAGEAEVHVGHVPLEDLGLGGGEGGEVGARRREVVPLDQADQPARPLPRVGEQAADQPLAQEARVAGDEVDSVAHATGQ